MRISNTQRTKGRLSLDNVRIGEKYVKQSERQDFVNLVDDNNEEVDLRIKQNNSRINKFKRKHNNINQTKFKRTCNKDP